MNRAYLGRFRREQRIVDLLERRAIRALLAEVRSNGPMRVLDVPCGYGRIAGEAGPVAAFMVQADRSAEILSVAKEWSGRPPRAPHPSWLAPAVRRLRIQLRRHRRVPHLPWLVCCDIRQLPFRNGAFDLIFVIRLWHHLKEAEARAAALSELRRVSTRYALVSHYRRAGLHALSRRIGSRFSKRVRINMLPPGQFEEEAAAQGFAVKRSVRVLPLVHAQTMTLLVRQAHHEREGGRSSCLRPGGSIDPWGASRRTGGTPP